MSVEIEGLEFQIEAKSETGSKGIDALTESFKRLKSALSGGAGMGTVTKQLDKLNETLDKVKNFSQLENLGKALESLNNVKLSSSVATNLTKIGEAAHSIQQSDIDRVNALANALKRVSAIGNINIPTVNTPATSGTTNITGTTTDSTGATNSETTAVHSYTESVNQAGSATRNFRTRLQELRTAFTNVFSPHTTPWLSTLGQILEGVSTTAKQAVTGFKTLGKALGSSLGAKVKQVTSGLRQLFSSLTRIAMYRLIRTFFSQLTSAMSEGISNLYQYSSLMGTTFAGSMDSLATSFLYLKNSMAAMVSPLINALAPAIEYVTDKVVALFNVINQLLARLTGSSTYTAAKKVATTYADVADGTSDAADDASEAADKLKKTILGFDEINALNDNDTSSTSGSSGDTGGNSGTGTGTDYGSMFEELPIDDYISDFADRLKEAFEAGDWEGAGTIIGDKINECIDAVDWSGIGNKIGYWINAAVQIAYYTLDTIDFLNLGNHLAELLNAALEQIDFSFVGRMVVKPFTSLIDLIIGFLGGLDWSLVATSLSDFLEGIFDEWSDWFDAYDWDKVGSDLYDNVKDFIENMDWDDIAESFWTAFNKALEAVRGLSSGWDESLSEDIESEFERIEFYVSSAELALGAILALSGANVPLGIALLANGALGVASVVSLNWDSVSDEVKNNISILEDAVGAASLAIGAVLAFSGNLPLGIALIAMGATSLVSGATLNWSATSDKVSSVISTITTAVSAATLATGAVLAFSGNLPLGIALIAIGAVSLASAVALNWSGLSDKVKGAVAVVTAAVSSAALAIGAVLAFSGTSFPLGIALMAAGAVGLASIATLNWSSLPDKIKAVVTTILGVVGAASLAIGAVLAFSGVNFPVGIALMAAGAASLVTAAVINWDSLTTTISSVLSDLGGTIGISLLALGAILAFSGVAMPLGIAMMAAGGASLVSCVALNWNSINDAISSALSSIGTTIINWINNIGESFSALGTLILNALNPFDGVSASDAWDTFQVKFSAIWSEDEDTNSVVNTISEDTKDITVNAVATTPEFDAATEKLLNATDKTITTTTKLATSGWSTSSAPYKTLTADNKNVTTTSKLSASGWNTNSKEYKALTATSLTAVTTTKLATSGWSTSSASYKALTASSHTVTINAKLGSTIALKKLVTGTATLKISANGQTISGATMSVAAKGGIITANGLRAFAKGGVITPGGWYKSLPKYASGTSKAHGTMFVAGEAGPEIVGHIGGRTEVLNQSQLASTMYSAVESAVSRFTGYWDAINQTIALCASAVIQAMPEVSDYTLAGASGNASGADDWAASLAKRAVSEVYGEDGADLSTGIREGLYDANARQNDILREQNELLRQLLDKDTTVEVTTNSFTSAINRKNHRDGKTVVPVNG